MSFYQKLEILQGNKMDYLIINGNLYQNKMCNFFKEKDEVEGKEKVNNVIEMILQ